MNFTSCGFRPDYLALDFAPCILAGNIYSRKLARRLLRWSLALILSLKITLRGDSGFGELATIMSPDELKVSD
jgi:hypothetical protein